MLRDLLTAMLPDLQAQRPVQCAEHVAKISGMKWPVRLRLEKNELIRSIGNYEFRQALRIAKSLLAALEGGDPE